MAAGGGTAYNVRRCAARQDYVFATSAQPIAQLPDQRADRVVVGSDVLASNVRDELLKAIRCTIKDQTVFARLIITAIVLRAEKQPKFQRHVEARQVCSWVKLGAADVVNAVAALADDFLDFADPDISSIVKFQRTPWAELTIN